MWDAPTILTLEMHSLAFVALHPAKEKIIHPSQLHSSLRQSGLQGVHDGSRQILQDHEAGLFRCWIMLVAWFSLACPQSCLSALIQAWI